MENIEQKPVLKIAQLAFLAILVQIAHAAYANDESLLVADNLLLAERVPVASSSLNSVGYDAQEQVLEIEFEGGEVYRYYGVSEEEHESLMNAPSKGGYFNSDIKNDHEYRRVR